jgi:hypothetical protein
MIVRQVSPIGNQRAVAMNMASGSGRKWLTALILSPGMIFASAYLLVWLSMNLWLNYNFKHHLKQIFTAETGQQYRIDIGSLRSEADLNSLTLKQLELTPVGGTENQRTNRSAFQIEELRIECADISFFPFKPADELLTLRKVCRAILLNSVQ